MGTNRFNLFIYVILLILYTVDAEMETIDASGKICTTNFAACKFDLSKHTELKGEKGENGSPGQKGEMGACGCEDKKEDPANWGTKANPGTTTCKYAPITKTGTYYLFDSIEVECDVVKKTTCIKGTSGYDLSYSAMRAFWFSEEGVLSSDIYGLTSEQLVFLKDRSSTATLDLRYYCTNTDPTKAEAPLLLLSWNDVIIGPTSTTASPLKYKVISNGCATAKKDEMKYTDIRIKSEAYRLPVMDFYVQDVFVSDQVHKIQCVHFASIN